MKLPKIFLLIAFVVTLFACNQTDQTSSAAKQTHRLNRDSILTALENSGKGDADSSLAYMRATLADAKASNDSGLQAQILYYMGMNRKIELDSGFYYLQRSLNIAKSLKDSIQMAKNYFQLFMNLYSSNFMTGREDGSRMNLGALNYGDTALQISSKIGDKAVMLSTIGRFAEFYMYLGRYDKTQFFLDSGYRALKSKHFSTEDQYLFNGVQIEFNIKTGNFDSALTLINQKLLRTRSINNFPGLSYFYSMGAKAWAGKGNQKKAFEFSDSALKIAQRHKLQKEYIDGITAVYEIYKITGNYKQALHYHERLQQLVDSINTQYQVQNAANFTAKLEAEQKEKAIELLTKDQVIDRQIKEKQRNTMIYLILGLILVSALAFLIFNRFVLKKRALDQSDKLLHNILPVEVAEELKVKGHTDAKLFDEVTVMFTDIIGFTNLSETMSAKELVQEIDLCFREFDRIIEKHGIEKIKTIGDSYMAAGGIPTETEDHASKVVEAALEIQQFLKTLNAKKQGTDAKTFEMRIGIHTGPVVAGIVGVRKFAYDIWGDTVNTASRMESSGEAGKVNISETTYEKVKNQFTCVHRGKISAKHKGEMEMYFVDGRV